MKHQTAFREADDGHELFVHNWAPDDPTRVRAALHIVHGMAEHAGRYARFAEALVDHGFAVSADDHRGHGRTGQRAGELGIFAEENGWERVLKDLHLHMEALQKEWPDRPLFLFGHSMGSYITQNFIIESGSMLRGAILSGTSGKPSFVAGLGRWILRAERLRLGKHGKSALAKALSFDTFNKKFKPNRTEFDWLSRDEAEVDKYIADELCGFEVSTQLWIDLLDAIARINQADLQRRIPKALPILIIAGEKDPVGEEGRSVRALIEAYQEAGLTQVTSIFYPDARHELLNEINRDEVTQDILDWLEKRLGS